jgi:hypothetical protein
MGSDRIDCDTASVGTDYPDPDLVRPIVDIFAQNNLRGASIVRIGERTLNWAAAFMHSLKRLNEECEQILDRYADRDDSLISMLEEISIRADGLDLMINIPYAAPQLAYIRNYQDLWYVLALAGRSQRQCYAMQPKKIKPIGSWT